MNRDRAHSGNRCSLVQAVATDDLSVLLSNYIEEGRGREHHREHMDSTLWSGKIGREVVRVGERCESLEAHFPAHFGVVWSSATDHDIWTFPSQRVRLCSHDDYLQNSGMQC